ncbi:MAG: DUF6623 family protein [Acidimicrobiia bacterium]
MSRFDYWTHGVSTFAEHAVEGLSVRHAGNGTVVKQPRGSDNWFHLAVPTPTIVDDEDEMRVKIMAFHASTQNVAMVKAWHVYMGGRLVAAQDLDLTGDHIYKDWQGSWLVSGPLNFSLRVEFLQDDSVIIFEGAGAGFED